MPLGDLVRNSYVEMPRDSPTHLYRCALPGTQALTNPIMILKCSQDRMGNELCGTIASILKGKGIFLVLYLCVLTQTK